jgi:hypothetical protein
MVNGDNETYYYNPITGKPVTATFLVTLVVPSNHVGQIQVEAKSEEEASRLALEKVYEIDWEAPRLRLHESEIEVLEVECLEEPEGALLFVPNGDSSSEDDNVTPVPAQDTDGQQ